MRILSIDGGGYLGLATAAFIEGIESHFNTSLHQEFELFCGTSTGAVIVLGLVTISWPGSQSSWKRTELIYPFLAALLFAAKDVTVRWGLSGSASPVLAAAIAAATSTFEVTLINLYVHQENFMLPPRKIVYWFLASGICTGGSFLFMFLALSMESVSIIAPLINSYAVFVLMLTPLLANKIEQLSARKIIGAILVVAGIFLISAGRD